jgi:CHAD domain-containing protein
MAYRLLNNEPIPRGLKRVVREEIDSAASHLRGERKVNRDEAIHEARKSIKKVRAILKLGRTELGDIYVRENAGLRDVAHRLSGFRDAAAIIETFDDLKQKYASEAEAKRISSVRKALTRQKTAASVPESVDPLIREAESVLRRIRHDTATWPLKRDGFQAFGDGLKEAYRGGRKALARAKKSPHPQNYHQLRKRVKDLWYHIRLMRSRWTAIGKRREKQLNDLETWLGDDHNLVLLRAGIVTDPDTYGHAKVIDVILDLIDRYQKKLRSDAIDSAVDLYREKPRDFIRRMKHLCKE